VENTRYDLELSETEMRDMVEKAMDRIVQYIHELPNQPAADVSGAAELARAIMEPMPEAGVPYASILDLLFGRLFPKTYNTAGPGYLAYIPGGGLFHSAVADLISNAVNRYVGVWAAAPALSQIEAAVARWFSDVVGYPAQARGLLTTGGSMANFTAIVTARRERLADSFFRGTIYASDQVHHSVLKAAILAGFPERNVREIESDGDYRIRIDALKQAIESDRREGWTPFLIVGNAGSTNTGAVDDLEALSQLARSEDLWLHVDGAYGAFFMLTDRGRQIMRGIEQSDSVTLDPHKALFIPYGTGSLLVRDGEALRRAHAVSAHYMPPMQDDQDFVDSCQYSPELSRAFRGLRVWLPLKMHGFTPFRKNLDEKLDLARWASAELKRIPGIAIVAEPQLSLVAFRLVAPGLDQEELNDLNHDLMARVNARQRVFLTGTLLSGSFVLRICVLSFRTHRDRMEACIEDIRGAVKELP
jgi:aromatic-L-amino-acid/L-tryptophan decarboxylase